MATRTARPIRPTWSPRKFEKLLAGRSDWEFAFQVREKTGVTIGPDSIRTYRKGRSMPPFDKAAAIAVTLGVSLDMLGE
jgi:hypothetical protein